MAKIATECKKTKNLWEMWPEPEQISLDAKIDKFHNLTTWGRAITQSQGAGHCDRTLDGWEVTGSNLFGELRQENLPLLLLSTQVKVGAALNNFGKVL